MNSATRSMLEKKHSKHILYEINGVYIWIDFIPKFVYHSVDGLHVAKPNEYKNNNK